MKQYLFVPFVFVGFIISFQSCSEASISYQSTKELITDSCMVVTAHPLASDIGVQIIKQGGNAIDAAIAVHFALAVCYPVAGNIGGGGFMIYRDNNGGVKALDFRETAPIASSSDMYLDDNGNVIKGLSTKGHLAVGVPGSVAGMYEAFSKGSKIKNWATLIQPAIDLAQNGFPITAKAADRLNKYGDVFLEVNGSPTPFNKSTPWKDGDIITQSDLAKTLIEIRDKGPKGFYMGDVANDIVTEMTRNGGVITLEDLSNYRPLWKTPIKITYRSHNIYTMPPSSSGGVVLGQILESIEPYDLSSYKYHSAEYVHLLAEAERRAYADRSVHLGDETYYDVPLEQLLDSSYIARRMSSFNPDSASKSVVIKPGLIESEETTHYSILDKEGNAISATTTINTAYGSKVVVGGRGFLLNNEMDDFSSKPGEPNFFGLIGAEANKIEPRKRMLSSMTPSIVEKDGQLKMVVGTPGGSTIITSVLQTILNVIDFEMTAYEAVAAPRFHHQWLPDHISHESNCLNDTIQRQLKNMGHSLQDRGSIGKVEAIVIKDNQIQGGADPRGDDSASGY